MTCPTLLASLVAVQSSAAQRGGAPVRRHAHIEALDAMGLAFNRCYVRTVTVEFYQGRK